MADIALLFGKFLLLALLYLFLLAAVRTGIGLVSARTGESEGALGLRVQRGPEEIQGVIVPIDRPVRIGRAPESELVIGDDFVSSKHAVVTPAPGGALLEDLGSTNGTVLNSQPVTRPLRVREGDVIEFGTIRLKVVSL